jgi:hypothetical protein
MYLLSPARESSRPNTVQSGITNLSVKEYNTKLLDKIRRLDDKSLNKNNSTQTFDAD